MRIRRKENWEKGLTAFIRAKKKEDFSWGQNDCCLFAADALFSMTDFDAAASYRGTYKTEAEAKKLLKKMGGLEIIIGTACRELGMIETSFAKKAKRGAIVLCHQNGEPICGVVDETGLSVLTMGKQGLVVKSIPEIYLAWSFD